MDSEKLKAGIVSCLGNKSAHALVTLAIDEGFHVWMEEVPSPVSPFVVADAASICCN